MLHYHFAILPDLGYPMRIELMIAESQPAVLPLNYGHHIEDNCDYDVAGTALVAKTFPGHWASRSASY